MKRAPEPAYDYNKSVRLNFERTLAPEYHRFRNWLSRMIVTAQSNKRPLSIKSRAQITESVDCLISNFIDAHRRSTHCFIGISLRESAFTKTRNFRRNIGYDNFMRVINFLRRSSPPFVIVKDGFNDRKTKISRSSRFLPSNYLLRLLDGYVHFIVNGNRKPTETRNITFIMQEALTYSPEREHIRISFTNIPTYYTDSADCIRLKDAEKKLKDYKDTPSIIEMRKSLTKWNSFLTENHHIDLLLPDSEIETLYEKNGEDLDAIFHEEKDSPQFVDFERIRLYRVFNNGSFKEGGRFYGGWWQQIPSEKRQFITINGRATSEYDYSNLHPAMLYADAGLPLAGDAYEIDGIEPTKHNRKLIKTTFLKLINARKGQRIESPSPSSLPSGWSWPALREAIIAKHEPIAEHFRSGAGLRLQKRDAEIAQTVMNRMMERNILALPVHDSFITYHETRGILQEEMRRAYQEHMGKKVGIEPDTDLVDRYISEIEGFELLPEEVVDHHQDQNGYDGFKSRNEAFRKTRSKEWDDRFGPWP